MGVKSRVSRCVRLTTAGVVTGCLFAFGPAVSASEQEQTPTQTPQSKTLTASGAPTTLRVTSDEAVRMALENNLGVRAERLSPQIETYGVAAARAVFAPNLVSRTTKRNSTLPPSTFQSGSGDVLTNAGFTTNGGVEQLVPWGGGRYELSLQGARAARPRRWW